MREVARAAKDTRRVVVTGLGVVSPVGIGAKDFWRALTSGTSGIGAITLFDASTFPVRIGGEVRGLDADAVESAFPGVLGEGDRKVWLGLAAAREAIEDARLEDELETAAVHVGAGLEEFRLAEAMELMARGDGARRRAGGGAAGAHVFQTPLDRTAGILGERYGFYGGRYTNTSACAAGAQVIGEAARGIAHGVYDVAVAGACDSMLNPLGLGGFALLRVLSAENDRPQTACRPFDATRQGTVLGEGAAFLALETLDGAQARGARVYAEVLGYGSSMDAFSVSDPEPSGRGAVIAMRKAVKDARISESDIDCISAHGTGTVKNDVVETAAIKEVFGERSYRIPIHAVKSMTGHMIAASGAVEAAAAALTVSEGVIPPTINLSARDPECDLDYTPGRKRGFAGRTVLSNSFGFGGQNAALIFGIYEA